MGFLGWLESKVHSNYPGKANEGTPRAGTSGPARWLVYGFAALALLWALGRVNAVLSDLGRAPSTPVSGTAAPAQLADVPGVSGSTEVSAFTGREYERALAAELAALLGQVNGAGRVEVSVSLARGPAYVFGYNSTSDTRTTEERDSTGGVRAVQEVAASQQPVILRDGAQGEKPLVAEEERPQVAGVLVLAEGASDSRVRTDLVRAVQALFELPVHRITVLPMGR